MGASGGEAGSTPGEYPNAVRVSAGRIVAPQATIDLVGEDVLRRLNDSPDAEVIAMEDEHPEVCLLHRVRMDGKPYHTLPADIESWTLVTCNPLCPGLGVRPEPEGSWADAMELMRTWLEDRWPTSMYASGELIIRRDEFLAATRARPDDECVHIGGKPPRGCGVPRWQHVGLMHSFLNKEDSE